MRFLCLMLLGASLLYADSACSIPSGGTCTVTTTLGVTILSASLSGEDAQPGAPYIPGGFAYYYPEYANLPFVAGFTIGGDLTISGPVGGTATVTASWQMPVASEYGSFVGFGYAYYDIGDASDPNACAIFSTGRYTGIGFCESEGSPVVNYLYHAAGGPLTATLTVEESASSEPTNIDFTGDFFMLAAPEPAPWRLGVAFLSVLLVVLAKRKALWQEN